MAIISKEKIIVCGDRHFTKVIKVNSRGRFSMDLPDFITEAFGKDEIDGPTLDHIEAEFGDLCKKFREAKVSTRRVIAFSFQANCDSEMLNAESVSFMHGLGLAVSAVMLDEKTTQSIEGDETYIYKAVKVEDDDGELNRYPLGYSMYDSSLFSSWPVKKRMSNIMEWTQEREIFFVELGQAMKNLIVKCDQILSDDESIQTFIASNQKLLTS